MMSSKEFAAEIEQIALPLTAADINLVSFCRDGRGMEHVRQFGREDEYRALGRRVVARTKADRQLGAEENNGRRRFGMATTIERLGHSDFNAWMDEATQKLLKRYGDEQTCVTGDFVSSRALEERGMEVRDLQEYSIETFFVYKRAARAITAAGLGRIAVKIDTDQPGELPHYVRLVAFGPDGSQTGHTWDAFSDVTAAAHGAFVEARIGLGLDPLTALRETSKFTEQAVEAARAA